MPVQVPDQTYNMESGLLLGEVPVHLLGPAVMPLNKAPDPQVTGGRNLGETDRAIDVILTDNLTEADKKYPYQFL